MAQHSISEAARLAGKARSTLHRHLADGRLSKTTAPDGLPVIDTAELVRVYGPLQALQSQSGVAPASVEQRASPPSDTRDKGFRDEIDALRRERHAALERRVAELEAERDAWKAQAAAWQEQARVALLRLPVPTPPASTPATPLSGLPSAPSDPPEDETPVGPLGLLGRLRWAVAGRAARR